MLQVQLPQFTLARKEADFVRRLCRRMETEYPRVAKITPARALTVLLARTLTGEIRREMEREAAIRPAGKAVRR